MAPVHAGDARREAVAFAVVGALQLGGAGLSIATRRRDAVVATAAIGALAAAAWAWSRRWSLPFDLGGPEDAGLVDGLTAGLELAAVGATFLVPRLPRLRSERGLLPLHLAAVIATVAVLAAPSTAEHGGHQHGGHDTAVAGDDHDHGATATGAACPEAGHDDPVTEPPLHFPAPRLDAARADALHALASESRPLPCGTTALAHGHAHGDLTPVESPLSAEDERRFDAQWSAASTAATSLATPERAAAAGYVQSSPQAPGVGTHWIDWTLIDAPFDPAHPSMLLFDERPDRPARLVGFSYWNRSEPGPPDGFAGPNDVWHGHVGLCFVDGWLFQEDVPSADDCGGEWLNGTDLWMLHAWVVADLPNPTGRFAGRHPDVCPGDFERVADALTCDPVGH